MTTADARIHRGARAVAIVLGFNAMWLGIGALRAGSSQLVFAALAAVSLVCAFFVWNAKKLLPERDAPVRRLAAAPLLGIFALLVLLVIIIVMAIAYLGGGVWK